MSSISNMPIDKEGIPIEGTEDYVWDHYKESVKMSTYLVAFVVSKFKFTETTLSNNVRFKIWSQPDLVDQTAFARDIGPKILDFFEGYFNIKFALQKQDMIAVPTFEYGAMENWGLITYKKRYLLLHENVTTAFMKQKIARTISHELAHQWFGKQNYVHSKAVIKSVISNQITCHSITENLY